MYAPGSEVILPSASFMTGLHDRPTLSRIFGHDFDTYVEAHLDAYDHAKRKWSDCTIEEWKAGADGMDAVQSRWR